MSSPSRIVKTGNGSTGGQPGQPYLAGRIAPKKPLQFLISQQPRCNRSSSIRGPPTFTQKMLSLKANKNKSSQKKEKAEDMSILANIQRYRRPQVARMLSGGGAYSSSATSSSVSCFGSPASTVTGPSRTNFSENKENSLRFHPYSSRWNPSSQSETLQDPGHVKLTSVPHLVTAMQTRVSLGMRNFRPPAEVEEPPPTQCSSIVSFAHRPLQSPWTGRNVEEIRGRSTWGKGLIPDPNVTRQMAIQDLVQIMCGNVAPPEGFFMTNETDDTHTESFGSNGNADVDDGANSIFGGSVVGSAPGSRGSLEDDISSSEFTVNLTAPFEVDILPPDASSVSPEGSVYF